MINDLVKQSIGKTLLETGYDQKCFELFAGQAVQAKDIVSRGLAGWGRIYRVQTKTGQVRITCWRQPGDDNLYYFGLDAVSSK
jgi:hypothetical protein